MTYRVLSKISHKIEPSGYDACPSARSIGMWMWTPPIPSRFPIHITLGSGFPKQSADASKPNQVRTSPTVRSTWLPVMYKKNIFYSSLNKVSYLNLLDRKKLVLGEFYIHNGSAQLKSNYLKSNKLSDIGSPYFQKKIYSVLLNLF